MKWWNPMTWFAGLPQWTKDILKVVWEIIKNILLTVGKDTVGKITVKIVEVSKLSVNNDKKFQMVFEYAKSLLPGMKDSAINLLIESLYNKLKTQGQVA